MVNLRRVFTNNRRVFAQTLKRCRWFCSLIKLYNISMEAQKMYINNIYFIEKHKSRAKKLITPYRLRRLRISN